MGRMRDDAMALIQKRLAALKHWDATEQARFKLWFGTTEEETKDWIQTGLTKMLTVMQGLTCASFVKYNKENLV